MKSLNQIFSMLIPVILLSMGLDYLDHGHLGGYNFRKWLIIGVVLGIVRVGYDQFFNNSEKEG